MAERVPPTVPDASANDSQDDPPNPRHGKLFSSSSFLDLGEEVQDLTPEEEKELSTYVVQIPKDQIYRVPPPENAKLVERLRNPSARKRNPCCRRTCWIILILLAIGAAIGIAILVLRQVYDPKAAVFSVANVVVKKNKSSRPSYEITTNVRNPNDKVEINYHSNGEAILYFKTQKLATGKFPEFHQEGSASRNVHVVLAGLSSKLPENVAKSMNDSKTDRPVSLELKLNLKGEMNLGTMNLWSKEMEVVCDFKVSTLRRGKKTKIISQNCDSQIK